MEDIRINACYVRHCEEYVNACSNRHCEEYVNACSNRHCEERSNLAHCAFNIINGSVGLGKDKLQTCQNKGHKLQTCARRGDGFEQTCAKRRTGRSLFVGSDEVLPRTFYFRRFYLR